MSNAGPPPPPLPPEGQPGYGAPGYGPPGYGPPGYGPPGYGPAGYGPPGYAGAPREHPDGTTVLVLGILGLVLCGILAPIAWVKGNAAKREIDSQPGIAWTNRGSVTAGRILGIVGTVIIGIYIVIFIVVIAAAVGSA